MASVHSFSAFYDEPVTCHMLRRGGGHPIPGGILRVKKEAAQELCQGIQITAGRRVYGEFWVSRSEVGIKEKEWQVGEK